MNDYRIPDRSILYNLTPIGLGTENVESLTSFLARLADAHSIRLSSLINHFVSPKINNLDTKSLIKINGFSNTTANVVDIIGSLTTNNELKDLTLLRFQGLVSDNRLLKRSKHWCSLCWSEALERGEQVYDKLIWNIFYVVSCPKHKALLEDKCPECGMKQPIIHSAMVNGYCFKCHKWLGAHKETNCGKPSLEQLGIDIMIEDLIRESNKLTFDLQEMRNALKYIKNNIIPTPKRKTLLENADIEMKTYERYIDDQTPGLYFLLKLSYFSDIPITEILRDRISTFNIHNMKSTSKISHLNRNLNEFNTPQIRNKIEELLADHKSLEDINLFPTNWNDLAKKLGCHRRSVRINLPELYQKVIEINEIRKTKFFKIEFNARLESIEKYVIELYNNGEYPSLVKVKEHLDYFDNRNENYYKQWRKTLEKLHIQVKKSKG